MRHITVHNRDRGPGCTPICQGHFRVLGSGRCAGLRRQTAARASPVSSVAGCRRSGVAGTSPSAIRLAEHRVEFRVEPELPQLYRTAAGASDPGSPRQRFLAGGHIDRRDSADGLRVRAVCDRPAGGHDDRLACQSAGAHEHASVDGLLADRVASQFDGIRQVIRPAIYACPGTGPRRSRRTSPMLREANWSRPSHRAGCVSATVLRRMSRAAGGGAWPFRAWSNFEFRDRHA